MEDFLCVSGADVVVSTIHKAKGREFDDVYMLVSDGVPKRCASDAPILCGHYPC